MADAAEVALAADGHLCGLATADEPAEVVPAATVVGGAAASASAVGAAATAREARQGGGVAQPPDGPAKAGEAAPAAVDVEGAAVESPASTLPLLPLTSADGRDGLGGAAAGATGALATTGPVAAAAVFSGASSADGSAASATEPSAVEPAAVLTEPRLEPRLTEGMDADAESPCEAWEPCRLSGSTRVGAAVLPADGDTPEVVLAVPEPPSKPALASVRETFDGDGGCDSETSDGIGSGSSLLPVGSSLSSVNVLRKASARCSSARWHSTIGIFPCSSPAFGRSAKGRSFKSGSEVARRITAIAG